MLLCSALFPSKQSNGAAVAEDPSVWWYSKFAGYPAAAIGSCGTPGAIAGSILVDGGSARAGSCSSLAAIAAADASGVGGGEDAGITGAVGSGRSCSLAAAN